MDDNQFSLFDIAEPTEVPEQIIDKKITFDQIQRLLEAFDAYGIIDQEDFISRSFLRPIQKLEDLLSREFPTLLSRIRASANPQSPISGSAWDNRDEDTWIDNL